MRRSFVGIPKSVSGNHRCESALELERAPGRTFPGSVLGAHTCCQRKTATTADVKTIQISSPRKHLERTDASHLVSTISHGEDPRLQ